MARAFAKMYVSTWDTGSDFYKLTADAQWLYWTLLSHPSLSPAGVLPLQPRKWARRAQGMTERRVMVALRELIETGQKVIIDEQTEELAIRTFLKADKGWRTPNVLKSIHASIKAIESDALRDAATHALTLAMTNGERDG